MNGADFRLMERRGKFLKTSLAPKLLATLHSSAVLRAPDQVGRDRLYGLLLTDLRLVASQLRGTRAGRRGRRRLA